MRTTIYYGLKRKSIKEMTSRVKGLSDEIRVARELAKKAASLTLDGHCEQSTIVETNKAAIVIRVKV